LGCISNSNRFTQPYASKQMSAYRKF
jgi:hypothetical protein